VDRYKYLFLVASDVRLGALSKTGDPLITIGGHETPGAAEHVEFVSDLAYIADGRFGLRVYE
jgi:hypothetical protein